MAFFAFVDLFDFLRQMGPYLLPIGLLGSLITLLGLYLYRNRYKSITMKVSSDGTREFQATGMSAAEIEEVVGLIHDTKPARILSEERRAGFELTPESGSNALKRSS